MIADLDATCPVCDGDGFRLVSGTYRPCGGCGGTGVDLAVVNDPAVPVHTIGRFSLTSTRPERMIYS